MIESDSLPVLPDRSVDAAPAKSELAGLVRFLRWLVIVVILTRLFVFAPFNIPSVSMLPQLYVGDHLFITKWNYGYTRHSLPFSLPLIPGRLFGRLPERGDVVVFRAPPSNQSHYIKRVIGLPGDTVQMVHGQVLLNGRLVPRQRVADVVIPISPNSTCAPDFRDRDGKGRPICRYPAFRETLPGGKSYLTLDHGVTAADDTLRFVVPAGHVFMMGDNRDDSEDSRFATDVGGIGFVPLDNLEGRAAVKFWSSDGSAALTMPWTWFTAARWHRIGGGF